MSCVVGNVSAVCFVGLAGRKAAFKEFVFESKETKASDSTQTGHYSHPTYTLEKQSSSEGSVM